MRRTILLATAVGALLAPAAALAATPAVSTGNTTGRTNNAATLHGTVNPEGSATKYAFQYGLTNAYGSQTSLQSAGSGTKAKAVARQIGGLSGGTIYHYRIVANNGSGTATGKDRTFKTTGPPPPTPITGPATVVTRTAATLTGSIDSQGKSVSFHFDFGTTPAYGVQSAPVSLPTGTGPRGVSVTLSGLSPKTLYHYRLVATTSSGTTFGADATTTTAPYKPIAFTANTKVGKHKHRRYVVATRGRVTPPFGITNTLGCNGNVAVRIASGVRTIVARLVKLNTLNCTYEARETFTFHKGSKTPKLRIAARFRGNEFLTDATARRQVVTVP